MSDISANRSGLRWRSQLRLIMVSWSGFMLQEVCIESPHADMTAEESDAQTRPAVCHSDVALLDKETKLPYSTMDNYTLASRFAPDIAVVTLHFFGKT